MENASKALLIAAGMLIAIMVVTLLVIGWNGISSYYQEKSESTKQTQLSEFNQQFERYTNESSIRGSDVLSLIGKINEYNTNQTSADGDGYEQMKITITIRNEDLKNIKYSSDAEWNIPSTIKESNINNILNKISTLESKYGSVSEVSKLSANITKFDISEKDQNFSEELEVVNSLLNKVTVTKSNYKTIRQDALSAYQITQFKRAHFECTSTKYNENTGRIISMTFTSNGKFE